MKELEIITHSPTGQRKGAVVFLHGACHAAWCWENYLNFFPQYGYEACAFSLPGHGASWGADTPQDIRFGDYLNATKQMLDYYSGEVVLVGHSLGGTIAQKVMADNPGIAKAGVLLATGVAMWLPGSLKETIGMMTRPQGRSVMKMMSHRIPTDAEAIRNSGFFNGRISLEDAERYRKLLVVEPPHGMTSKLSVDYSAIKVLMMVLTSDIDVCSTIAHQEKIAGCYGVKPTVLYGLCHDMMLDPEWKKSANSILDFMENSIFV
jgi:pimeloyl-ACP methyl ester carboxylesterase